MEIPYQQLSAETLRNLIEAYILRDGTDYGTQEVSLEAKVKEVRRQLDVGKAKIVFDPETESVNLVTQFHPSEASEVSVKPPVSSKPAPKRPEWDDSQVADELGDASFSSPGEYEETDIPATD